MIHRINISFNLNKFCVLKDEITISIIQLSTRRLADLKTLTITSGSLTRGVPRLLRSFDRASTFTTDRLV